MSNSSFCSTTSPNGNKNICQHLYFPCDVVAVDFFVYLFSFFRPFFIAVIYVSYFVHVYALLAIAIQLGCFPVRGFFFFTPQITFCTTPRKFSMPAPYSPQWESYFLRSNDARSGSHTAHRRNPDKGGRPAVNRRQRSATECPASPRYLKSSRSRGHLVPDPLLLPH